MVNDKSVGGSAFPRAGYPPVGNGEVDGMSLRDYFAAKAMQGMATSIDGMSMYVIIESIPVVASISYAIADAMLAERAK